MIIQTNNSKSINRRYEPIVVHFLCNASKFKLYKKTSNSKCIIFQLQIASNCNNYQQGCLITSHKCKFKLTIIFSLKFFQSHSILSEYSKHTFMANPEGMTFFGHSNSVVWRRIPDSNSRTAFSSVLKVPVSSNNKHRISLNCIHHLVGLHPHVPSYCSPLVTLLLVSLTDEIYIPNYI